MTVSPLLCRWLPPLLLLAAPITARAEGTAVWLSGAVDPTVVDASTYRTAADLGAAAPWGPADDEARDRLAGELEAVRPLLDVFDGELQVLRRLDAAIGDITVIRAEDRTLIRDARILQGLAVHRYYPADSLATDPDAAPWRTTLPDGTGGSLVVNRAWVDAIALDPETLPGPDLMPDDDARISYQDVRARLLIAGDATIAALDLPPGARLVVDGADALTGRARVLPGEHRVAIVDDEGIRLRHTIRAAPDQSIVVPVPARTEEIEDLGRQLDGDHAIVLPPRVATSLAGLERPVFIVAGDRRSPVVYRVDGETALPVDTGAARSSRPDDGSPGLRADLAVAWVYDGEWYLEQAERGAPAEVATVNGALPMLSLGADVRVSALSLGAGADLAVGTGTWQRLQVGETSTRLRFHPHVAAGLPWLQATVGAWLPWRLGLGARAHLPLPGPLELTGGGLLGLGLPIPDDPGDPFVPAGAWSAWLGVGARLPD